MKKIIRSDENTDEMSWTKLECPHCYLEWSEQNIALGGTSSREIECPGCDKEFEVEYQGR